MVSLFRRQAPAASSSASSSESRLGQLVQGCGVLQALERAGLQAKTLRAGWRDESAQAGLLFFMVPEDPDSANFGWFTPEELLEWSEGRGVVMKDPMLDELDGRYGYSRRADKMLERAGVAVRAKCIPAWVSAETRIPGVRVLVDATERDYLPDGTYSLAHLAVMLSTEEIVDPQI